MKIEVLGTGCASCTALFEIAKKAVAQQGIFAQVEKVEDLTKIMEYGVMSMPGFVINGKVKSVGKQLNEEEVIALLEEAN